MGTQSISGYTLAELTEQLKPLPAFRAKQVFKWIARGAVNFEAMTDLSQALRSELAERFLVHETTIADTLTDTDGTIKLQISLQDGTKIEAVVLVDGEGRKTACISTQVGCPMACAFCKTGSLGFLRNLSAAEITEQLYHCRSVAGDIANIVIMGMGEPLLNLENLRKAMNIWSDPAGLGMSRRRMTISTSGIISGIRDLADRGPDVRLAISLTTADASLRELLMPVTKTNPLPELKEALRYFQSKHDKRITLEAVMLGGLTTRKEDALAIADFAKGLDVIINLIPWNPVEGMGIQGKDFSEPTDREIDLMVKLLEQRGLTVTRRYRKGRGVSGACGQLGSVDTFKKD
jgi:23S rRNA (adenine2503-C2)-methyltransferase